MTTLYLINQDVCHLNVYNHVVNSLNEIYIPNIAIFVPINFAKETSNMTITLQNPN